MKSTPDYLKRFKIPVKSFTGGRKYPTTGIYQAHSNDRIFFFLSHFIVQSSSQFFLILGQVLRLSELLYSLLRWSSGVEKGAEDSVRPQRDAVVLAGGSTLWEVAFLPGPFRVSPTPTSVICL